MSMEKEALTHKIEDDLAARNRNWDKVDSLQTAHDDLEAAHAAHLADDVTQGNPHGIDAKANRALGTIYSATMLNGWGGSIRYCKNDVGMVAVYTDGSLTTGAVSEPIVVLPTGYRPQSTVYALVNKGNITPYDLAMGLSINSLGQIHIKEPLRSLLTQGRNDGLSFYVVFQVDN